MGVKQSIYLHAGSRTSSIFLIVSAITFLQGSSILSTIPNRSVDKMIKADIILWLWLIKWIYFFQYDAVRNLGKYENNNSRLNCYWGLWCERLILIMKPMTSKLKLYTDRYSFNFSIVKCLFICRNIPAFPAFVVFYSSYTLIELVLAALTL